MTARLVLGLGGTVDYEVDWDSEVLEHLVGIYGIGASELRTSLPIETERDLVVCVLAFLKDGAGGERFVASSELVEQFASRFHKKITVGGTCVRAAIALAAVGIESVVHLVCIDDNIRALLPAGCEYICSADEDSTDPHLIVQFGAGVSVRTGMVDLRPAHPNRIIFANDPPNRELKLSPQLGSVLSEADLFMVSGFNTIQDEAVLEARLEALHGHMRALPEGALVLYEDAGFHVPALSRRVRAAMNDAADVFSMNEDEMQGHLGRPLDMLHVESMATALTDLRTLIPAPVVVVHTKHWAVAVGDACQRYEQALRGGMAMATTRYKHGDGFTADDHREVRSLPRDPKGQRFCDELRARLPDAVACAPAYRADVASPTMIGLGDTFVGGFVAELADPASFGRPRA